jgi:hypothetical protein
LLHNTAIFFCVCVLLGDCQSDGKQVQAW